MQDIGSQEQFDAFVQQHPATAVWFSAPDCNVCHALFPKVVELLQQEFPRLQLARVDCAEAKALAAAQSVFSIPTLVLCFDGREGQRLVRNFSLGQVRDALARPYQLLFE